MTRLLSLTDPRAADPSRCGRKAARLADLAQRGFAVPEGWVLPADAPDGELAADLAEVLTTLGGRVAARSSGVAEDLGEASFAGLYETVLDLSSPEALLEAVARVRSSARAPRVTTYLAARGLDPAPVAVLIQRMVPARASGVAFTADPVTGARNVVAVSAVAGQGEALVGGVADAEEWVVGASPERRGPDRGVLSGGEASAVAGLAREVAAGSPTDVEWALDTEGRLHLLQARPMTAVPEPWEAPVPGGFVRNLRLGEWIGNPVTPLFETWLLTDLEERLHAHHLRLVGIGLSPPYHVVVNGWYFYGLNISLSPGTVLRALPRLLWSLLTRFSEVAVCTPPIAHLGFTREYARWKEELLPRFERAVAAARVEDAPVAELVGLVQGLIDETAIQLQSVVGVAGYAAKAELRLLRLWRRHLPDGAASPIALVSGGGHAPGGHDLEDLDWSFPTLGERGLAAVATTPETEARVRARRDADTERALEGGSPAVATKLRAQLDECRRAHRARIEQTGLFTLAWPKMRRALLRLGGALRDAGRLADPAEVFYLRRDELAGLLAGRDLHPPVAERRAAWERQRRLDAPLTIGRISPPIQRALDELHELTAHPEHREPDALVGLPASGGRVTGTARVILRMEDLARLQPGEILVAPVTTPSWTIAFGRAAAVVTDTGSLASHASVVAREHGLPAVVATGAATRRIADGQRVTVDGGRGLVRLHPTSLEPS